ncbi:hypothetical protein GCM10010495_46980 [Kitasatospora herbaricolor]|nr:hypothetical protein GCM10010495_46980 [Kitasatospora herbaricolor]
MRFVPEQDDPALQPAAAQRAHALGPGQSRPDNDHLIRVPLLSHGATLAGPSAPCTRLRPGRHPELWWVHLDRSAPQVPGGPYHGSPADRAERRAGTACDRPNLIRVIPAKGEQGP